MVPSTGEAIVKVTVRAYNATRELNITSRNKSHTDSFTLGTRVLLTCDVTGLPEGREVISYKWYHMCTGPMCEIQEGTPYYRAVDDTLLVDVTSHDLGGRYYCEAKYPTNQSRRGFTPLITVAG